MHWNDINQYRYALYPRESCSKKLHRRLGTKTEETRQLQYPRDSTHLYVMRVMHNIHTVRSDATKLSGLVASSGANRALSSVFSAFSRRNKQTVERLVCVMERIC